MTKKFIAPAIKGKEFIFHSNNMIAVPTSSAKKIADALTRAGYKLKDGEVWHIYDNDPYYDNMISSEIKQYGRRMKIYRYDSL